MLGEQARLQFWDPGTRRKLRLFVSHRYGDDESLYVEVLAHLKRQGFGVQDLSLTRDRMEQGPRGGMVNDLAIQSRIAARIYTSDILIAPSRPAVTRSEWVTWEVELAALGYGLPVLFVDHSTDLERRTYLVRGLDAAGANYRVCNANANEIAFHVAQLVAPPYWEFREKETDIKLRHRGPLTDAREEVMRLYPYEANDTVTPPR